MSRKTDDLEVESGPLSAERERDFEAWVRGRLSDWTYAEIRAFDGWLLDEAHFEFVPAVRAAWKQRGLEDAGRDPEEPAA